MLPSSNGALVTCRNLKAGTRGLEHKQVLVKVQRKEIGDSWSFCHPSPLQYDRKRKRNQGSGVEKGTMTGIGQFGAEGSLG